jgi:hypothetical protein
LHVICSVQYLDKSRCVSIDWKLMILISCFWSVIVSCITRRVSKGGWLRPSAKISSWTFMSEISRTLSLVRWERASDKLKSPLNVNPPTFKVEMFVNALKMLKWVRSDKMIFLLLLKFRLVKKFPFWRTS